MSAGHTSDLDAARAQIGAMRTEFLHRAELSTLRSCLRADQALVVLAQTSWRSFVDLALSRYLGARALLEASRLRLADGCRRVASLYSPPERRAVDLVLARFDLRNLQALLRAKHTGASEESALAAMVPAGILDDVALVSLACEPSLEGVLDQLTALNRPYGDIFFTALAAYRASQRWADTEAELERGFYAWLGEVLEEEGPAADPVRELVRREVDVVNAVAALRLEGAPASERTYWAPLPAGNLPEERWVEVASAPTRETAVRVLEGSWLAGHIPGGRPGPVEVEAALRLECFRRASKLSGRAPRGVEPAIAYVSELAAETAAVRRVAAGLMLEEEEEAGAFVDAPQ